MNEFTIGELRHTSAGNVFELLAVLDNGRVKVRRVAVIGRAGELWDHDVSYVWSDCQWDSIPLVGERSDDPSFGVFVPC